MNIEQAEKELREAQQRVREELRADLRAVLKKYGAEIRAEDHWRGYAGCGEDVRMTVEVSNHPVASYLTLDLGWSFDMDYPVTAEEGK